MIAYDTTFFSSTVDRHWRRQVLLQLTRIRYQLLGGAIFGLLVPFLVAANLYIDDIDKLPAYLASPVTKTSISAGVAALLMGFLILRKTASLPGSEAIINVVPSFVMSFCAGFLVLFALRLEYSQPFLASSAVGTTVWFLVSNILIERAHHMTFGVIPGGRADDLSDITSVTALPLRSIKEAEAKPSIPLVADFRSDTLSEDWERYIAEQAIQGRAVYNAKQLVESLEGRVQIDHLSENSFGQIGLDLIYRRSKRGLDGLVSLALLIGLSPLLLIVAMLIRLDSPGPAIFKQTRMGFRGKPFTVYKFRSMHVQSTADRLSDMTQSDDDRITRIGHILRRLRIDELPQMVNVLRGEMSWIGPRPETLNLSEWYESEIPFYRIRHAVRPGITGWAQVQQGHVTSVEDVRRKLEFDLFYVKHFSLWLDIVIVIHTIGVILTRKGAR